jgi:hypothetical protein
MFERANDIPVAVTGETGEALMVGLQWCAQQMADGDVISLYVPLQQTLSNNTLLGEFGRMREVEVITSRGSTSVKRGPVFAVYPNMADLGKLARSRTMTALCVGSDNEHEIGPWVQASSPEVLDEAQWGHLAPPTMDPIVTRGITRLSAVLNLNNTVSSGTEKNILVGGLLMLHDAGHALDAEALQGWALANGWTGNNPSHLAKYVRDINAGKRPRVQASLRPDWVQTLTE